MIATDSLMIATFIMSIISMVLSCMALWPQCKDGLVVVRDRVLWFSMIAIVVGAATLVWRVQSRTAISGNLFSPPLDDSAVEYVDWTVPTTEAPQQAIVGR